MQYFPLFMKLTNKPVLVVGGGEVACRKVEALLKAGANVTIVSPKLRPYLQECVQSQQCDWIASNYNSEYLSNNLVQVWATTDDNSVNHQVYNDAKMLNLMVNVVDDQPYCDFITPSMIERGDIQIAISSGGASPVLVRNIRQMIEANLAQNVGLLAKFAASKRDDIKQRLPSVDRRRDYWQVFFEQSEVAQATELAQLEKIYQRLLDQDTASNPSITLIELPSAVDLLTLRALQQLQRAELVLYPSDCDYELVDIARRDAERERYQDIEQLILQAKQHNELQLCVYVRSDELSKVKAALPNGVVCQCGK